MQSHSSSHTPNAKPLEVPPRVEGAHALGEGSAPSLSVAVRPEEVILKVPSPLAAALVAGAVAVPAVAIAQDTPEPPTPRQAYGVICDRPPYEAPRSNVTFSECVTALARGVNGRDSAADAARNACRSATPPLPGDEFGECVASTRTLVLGLRELKAR